MTLKNILKTTISNYKIEYLQAEMLLCFILQKPKEFIYTHPDYKLTEKQITKLEKLARKLSQGVPLAQLTHQKYFFGLKFWINQNVLIPRPETEIMVEKIIELTKKHFTNQTITLADIGTGSGCIAISLAKNIKHAKIHTSDISKKALYIARKNAKLHDVSSKITFHHGDLLEPILNKKIDIVAANLPYVPSDYQNNLTKSYNRGLKFEPKNALYSGKDGLKHYRRFFKQIKQLKYLPKFILIEIDSRQVKEIKKIIKTNFKNPEIKIIADYNQKNRFVLIENTIR